MNRHIILITARKLRFFPSPIEYAPTKMLRYINIGMSAQAEADRMKEELEKYMAKVRAGLPQPIITHAADNGNWLADE